MIFALGALVAGLLMLGLLPAVWNRAERLATRRLEMRMPLSIDEIAAERDTLRAEFAVDRRRLEQHAERLITIQATDRAELGRRAVRGAAQDETIADQHAQIAGLLQADAAMRLNLRAAEAGLAQINLELYANDAKVAQTRAALEAERAARAAADELVLQQRAAIAAHVTRLAGLEMRGRDNERILATALQELAEKNAEAQASARDRDAARAQSALHLAALEAAQADLACDSPKAIAAENAKLRRAIVEVGAAFLAQTAEPPPMQLADEDHAPPVSEQPIAERFRRLQAETNGAAR